MKSEEQNDQNVITLLQFAYKANKLALGQDNVIKKLLKNKVLLILYTKELSLSTIKKINKYATQTNVKSHLWGDKELYQSIFGNSYGILGVTDKNFYNGLKKYFSWMKTEE